MKKILCGKRKLNNAGATLLEAIIAVAILSVAVGSMLQIFAYSTRLNARAREQQHVNSAAESVMEGLKGYDIEQIYRQFSGDESFKVFNGGGNPAVIPRNIAGVTDGYIDGMTGEFVPASDHSYAFAIQHMQVDGSDYDAYIRVNPVSSHTWTVADVDNINEYTDAIYRQDYSKDIEKVAEIKGTIESKLREIICFHRGLPPTDAYSEYEEPDADALDMEKITITKITEISMQDAAAYVNVKYLYVVDEHYDLGRLDGVADEIGTDPADPSKSLIEGELLCDTETIYSGAGTGSTLKNVYLFYYPAYTDTTDIKNEEITLYTAVTSRDINVYLLKQKWPGYTDTSIQIAEGSYTSNLKVDGNSQRIILFHNLNYNLINNSVQYYPTINGVKTAESLSVSRSTSHLLEDSNKILLYQVVVDIYAEGLDYDNIAGYEPLLTLKGSINSK